MSIERAHALILVAVLALPLAACRDTSGLVEAPAAEPAAATDLEAEGVALIPGSAYEISVETAAAMQAEGSALMIDVREPSEYAQGHIPGITLIPMSEIGDRLSEIPRDQPVILSCRSGSRSASVAEFLIEQGYDQIYSQQGGILAWEGAGQPVER